MSPAKRALLAPALMALLAVAFIACAIFHLSESEREKYHRANIAEASTLSADQQTIRHTLSVTRLDSAVLERRFKLVCCIVLGIGCSFCAYLFRQVPIVLTDPVSDFSAAPQSSKSRHKRQFAT